MAFPDGWTEFGKDGERMSDSARYKMLGNAVVVKCIEEIAKRF
jgi:DNA (cytosine-5)-methyltransferase 1